MEDGRPLIVCKDFCFIENYIFPDCCVLGQWDEESKCYILGDGDGHPPECIAGLGSAAYFFGFDFVTDWARTHFRT